MFTIFGDEGSGAFSAEAALAEAGAPYELRLVSLENNEQRAPDFLALNPTGKMPALRLPTGEIVTESLAIMLTVAERYPDAHLLPPAGSDERARAYRWLSFMATEIYPMVEISDYAERFTGKGDQAAALRSTVRERIRDRVLVLEREVAGPWFLASDFSLVDIYAAMFSRWRGEPRDSVGERRADREARRALEEHLRATAPRRRVEAALLEGVTSEPQLGLECSPGRSDDDGER